MKDYGFLRVSAAVPQIKVTDIDFNLRSICELIDRAVESEVSLLAFPELCVTGYTCGDLIMHNSVIDGAERAVRELCSHTENKKITIAVGVPVKLRGRLYNCCAVISGGALLGLVPKIWIPNYNEFYEARWFASGSDFLGDRADLAIYAGQECEVSPNLLFKVGKATVGIEICEDLWTPIPPSSHLAVAGADLIVNLSATDEILMKDAYRKELVRQQSARAIAGYLYCSAGWGESSQDLVFAGAAYIYENGTLLAENERFQKESSMIMADIDIDKVNVLRRKMSTFDAISPDGTPESAFRNLYSVVEGCPAADTDFEKRVMRYIDPSPFVPDDSNADERDIRCREITAIQVSGLARRLQHIGCDSAVVGISGGLDSTLALLVTAMAFDYLGWERRRIIGVTMPGFGTTIRTKSNAVKMMEELGVTTREIPIGAAVELHFKDIGHDPSLHDVTYENSQARERTQILMDIANQTNGIVIGTGDLSELALGWATYNGDHMSMYGVNAGIPKTLVRHLVKWAADNRFKEIAETLYDVVDTPVSPELLPADKDGNIQQVTEDLVGPYDLHDFFLYHFFRFGCSPEKIFFLARKAFDGKFEDEIIKKWLKVFLRRFIYQQFKRSCLPDGPKVGSVSISPRGDWRMPSDASAALLLNEVEKL